MGSPAFNLVIQDSPKFNERTNQIAMGPQPAHIRRVKEA
jgi:hypothetical protein